MKKIIIDEQVKNKIIKLYKNGVSTPELSKNFGFTIGVILRCLKENDIKIRSNSEAQRKYKHDSIFFNTPNDINCYFAGFICADGYINIKKRNLVIQIKKSDEEVLINFKKFLKAEEPILDIKYDGRHHVRISIVDEKIVEDLKKIFNISQAKTFDYVPLLNIQNEGHIKSFIRGFTDGDGCVGHRKNKNNCYISWIGTKEMMEWLYCQIKERIDIVGSPNIYKTEHKNLYRLRFGGVLDSFKIIKWLYDEVPYDLKLNRKHIT